MFTLSDVIMWCLSLALLALTFWYIYIFQYWKKKNVEGPFPVPVFGNMLNLAKKETMGTVFQKLYEENKHRPYTGIFMFHRPALLVTNLDLVKMIMVRDFHHFTDHGFEFDLKTQPLANHLFNTNGGRWKGLRNKLTPAFTSSKMKYMFEIMASCGEEVSNFLKNDAKMEAEIDMKEIVARYATDVIVSCAFGIDSNCLKHPDAEFRKMGRRVFEMDLKRNMYLFMTLLTPKLQKYINGKVIEDCVAEFFIEAVETTIKHREENNITRNDLMQLLIKLKNNESIEDNESAAEMKQSDATDVNLTNLELAAQAFGFFVGGFETSSTTLSFMFYDLAKNPEIQSKLRKEIDDVLSRHGGKITYEAVNEMKYLFQIIDETLRIRSTGPVHFRLCTKDYKIPYTNVNIEKDTLILISASGIHMDPDIYPEPNKFDPDRFSTENKNNRHHFAFLPFGEGPRICIGMRFALIQMAIAVISIIRHYEVSLGENSKLEIDQLSFITTPKNTILKIKNRSN